MLYSNSESALHTPLSSCAWESTSTSLVQSVSMLCCNLWNVTHVIRYSSILSPCWHQYQDVTATEMWSSVMSSCAPRALAGQMLLSLSPSLLHLGSLGGILMPPQAIGCSLGLRQPYFCPHTLLTMFKRLLLYPSRVADSVGTLRCSGS